MSRPSTPHVNNGNAPLTYGCDYNASTSSTSTSWPLTELALETPERLRLQFKKHTSPSIMSPPQRSNTIRSPQTPKLIRVNQQKPGESFFKASPSPLRRFKISQSSIPLSDKFGKTSTPRIEYRFCGNNVPLPIASTTLPLSNIESNLNQTTSSSNDSGFYSSLNDSSLLSQNLSWEQSNIFDDCNIFTENTFSDSFSENLWEYSSDSFVSQTSATESQLIPTSLSTSLKSQAIDFNAGINFTPAPPSVSSTTSANVTVSSTTETENEQKAAAKLKQKTLEDEVLNSLDKYHDEPFNINYAKELDMTEFKKLKLFLYFAMKNE
uniref:Uncharacterized protein n=1 Tax=Panagrolaimus sp. PS1159 TaxID=55785 RepID=A0AC35GPT7_9BILA